MSKLLIPSLIAAGLASACSSDSETADPGNPDASVTPGVDIGFEPVDTGMDAVDMGFPETGPVDAGTSCPADPITVTPRNCPAGAQYIALVRGIANLSDGAPTTNVLGQMCIETGGFPTCLQPQPTCTDQGYFQIIVPEAERCVSAAVFHMIPLENTLASSFCNLDIPDNVDPDLTVAAPFTSYSINQPTTLPAEGDVTTERVVVFADGTEVDVTPQRMSDYSELRNRRLTAADPLPCAADAQNFDGIIAFGPEGNIQTPQMAASPGFPIRIPVTGVNDGAQADIFVQGSLECLLEDGERVKEGEWEQFATGTVVNGMLSGFRLPCFAWMAWRFR